MPPRNLNFFPYYEQLLEARAKTTTLRLGKSDYLPGEIVNITVGWTEAECRILYKAEILQVYQKAINALSFEDLEGESPDCLTPEAVPYVLGCIYRKQLSSADSVSVVKFRHLG